MLFVIRGDTRRLCCT